MAAGADLLDGMLGKQKVISVSGVLPNKPYALELAEGAWREISGGRSKMAIPTLGMSSRHIPSLRLSRNRETKSPSKR